MPDMERTDDAAGDMSKTSVIGYLSGMSAIAVAVGLTVSFAYDWGFFWALGVNFAQAPTSTFDHLRSWLVWVPIVMAMGFVFLTLELLSSRIERGLTEREIVESSEDPERLRRSRDRPWKLIDWLAGLVVFLWLLFGEKYSLGFGLIFAAPILWRVFVRWVFNCSRLSARCPMPVKIAVDIVPAAFLCMFFLGANSARDAVSQTAASHHIRLAGQGSGNEQVEARLLRSFENWILLWDGEEKVLWVRTDSVVRVRALEEGDAFEGFVCALSIPAPWCSLDDRGD